MSGRFNGGLDTDIAIDTGAELATVSREIADERDIMPISSTVSAGVGDAGLHRERVGLIDELYIDGLSISNLPCLISAQRADYALGRYPDSFSPLAAGLSMSVDYRRRELTIARHLPAGDPPDFELPLWLYRLATVRGVVGKDTESAFIVDTGGQAISISRETEEALGLPVGYRRIPLKVNGLSGIDTGAFLLPGMRVAFDTLHLDSTSLVVLNLDAPSALLGFEVGGTVGHRLLSRYRSSIDLDRNVLALKAQ